MSERGINVAQNHQAMHVSIIGYAIFMVINATQIWGGVFPFLPVEFQTDAVTLSFYLSQALAFCVAFIASTFGSYYFPAAARRMLVTLSTALVFCGSASIIAAMYITDATMALVVAGGVFLGVGCAGMFMMWQRYFSSIPAKDCNYRLIMGTAVASVMYFTLHLVPMVLTAFLVPVVFLPLCALCLTLSVREMQFDQPMFEDIPREHPAVYLRVIRDFWRSALGVGALAFCSGLARGVAVIEPSVAGVVNISSMLGSLIAAVALLAVWRATSLRFSLRTVFRVAYPLLITALLLFPFLEAAGLGLFVGLTYMLFSLILLVMMMQSAQISRERGINPVFIYGFFGSTAYLLQSIGFLLGWFAHDIEIMGVGQVTLLTILASYVLGMALFTSTGRVLSVASDGTAHRDDQIELVKTAPRKPAAEAPAAQAAKPAAGAKAADPDTAGTALPAAAKESKAEKGGASKQPAKTAKPARPRRREVTMRDGRAITDRLSKQFLVIQDQYGLSARETEVAELIARGRSMAAIAEELFVSENTVRTHAKHIYTKLDIHSRQELGDLLKDVELGDGAAEAVLPEEAR